MAAAGAISAPGGPGNDYLKAAFLEPRASFVDVVNAGPRNDMIEAVEGKSGAEFARKDCIDCGPGFDGVFFDRGLDTIRTARSATPSKTFSREKVAHSGEDGGYSKPRSQSPSHAAYPHALSNNGLPNESEHLCSAPRCRA